MHPSLALEQPHAGLLLRDAQAQAEAIRAGRVAAEELLRLQLDAIDRLDPLLNAFVQPVRPGHRPDRPAPSPLAGSTFAVKDNIDVAGFPSHAGLRALEAAQAMQDAPVVARLKAAGLVFVGKLNMHAMALGATGRNADFGDCRNPHRPSHTPGGSSSGSAAAVAAGLCGVALGTDTMGSVRVPASYCGVVGFKPSFEALPMAGVTRLSSLLDHVGILARSVEDVVAAYRIAAGAVPGPAPASPAPGNPLRLAFPADLSVLGATAEVVAAFEAGLARLRDRGLALAAADFTGYPLAKARRAGLLLCEAELHAWLGPVLDERRDRIPGELLSLLAFAGRRSAVDAGAALRVVMDAARWLSGIVAEHDALVLPTTPQAAFPMDAPAPANQADLTALANMNGAPAISLPLPVPAGTLPVGLQLVGRRGQDEGLLQAALAVQLALA